jgi:hypothetical protein
VKWYFLLLQSSFLPYVLCHFFGFLFLADIFKTTICFFMHGTHSCFKSMCVIIVCSAVYMGLFLVFPFPVGSKSSYIVSLRTYFNLLFGHWTWKFTWGVPWGLGWISSPLEALYSYWAPWCTTCLGTTKNQVHALQFIGWPRRYIFIRTRVALSSQEGWFFCFLHT